MDSGVGVAGTAGSRGVGFEEAWRTADEESREEIAITDGRGLEEAYLRIEDVALRGYRPSRGRAFHTVEYCDKSCQSIGQVSKTRNDPQTCRPAAKSGTNRLLID